MKEQGAHQEQLCSFGCGPPQLNTIDEQHASRGASGAHSRLRRGRSALCRATRSACTSTRTHMHAISKPFLNIIDALAKPGTEAHTLGNTLRAGR